MKENIIEVKDLSKSYNGKKAVIGLNLTIGKGQFFGFLGPNGAGKTTTIRMLTDIIPPDKGEIIINGKSIISDKKDILETIGVVPESRGFYGWMSALEYLNFFGHLFKIRKDQLNTRINHLLRLVGLFENRNQRVGTFSNGMKQRLALARALLNKPVILFLDEPTNGLDPQGQEDIKKLLLQLNKEGVTIFISTHLLHEVEELCSHIAIINKGVIAFLGTIDELKQKTKKGTLTEMFLSLTRK
jgi:ABC-2 type transport system ATP-binding protein